MARILKVDPQTNCPFFIGFDSRTVLCGEGEIFYQRIFPGKEECAEYREDFCRCRRLVGSRILFAYPACPCYAMIAEQVALKEAPLEIELARRERSVQSTL